MKNKLIFLCTLISISFSGHALAGSSCLLDFEVVIKNTLNDPDLNGVYDSFDNLTHDNCRMTARLRAVQMLKTFSKLETGIASSSILGMVVNYEFVEEVVVDGEITDFMVNDSIEILKPKKQKLNFKKSILPLSALK